MKNPVVWFEIYVDDMERAKAFYEGVFMTELSKLESDGLEMWAFGMDPNASGAAGALVKMPGFGPGRNSVLVYFQCDDCAVEAQRAVQHGGRLERGKFSIGAYGHVALVIDSEGNMIGLHSMQ